MNIPIKHISEISTPPVGYGYIFVDAADNKLKVKKHNTIVEYTNTLNDIQLLDLSDYTAFEVLIHGTDVKAGDTIDGITYNYDFAGTYTHSFRLRTGEVDNTTSDVIIDWGDGTIHAIANGDYYSKSVSASSKETDYELTHTYNNEGKYIIKIYGRMYYGISVCSGSMPSSLNHNCICRLFDNDLPIASNLTNISSMCRYAYRLTSVDVPSYLNLSHISNISLLFNSCTNLKTVKGLKNQFLVVTAAGQIFEKCYSLQTCEFTLPVAVTRSSLNSVFHYCISLTTPIQDFFPAGGFIGGTLNVDNIFTSCRSMPGTVPADMLWNNKNVKFTNTTYAFWGNTPDAIRSQVPASWGGMASDNIIKTDFLTIQRPVFDDTLFPKVILSKDIDFTDTIEFNPLNTSTDLNYFKVFTGDYWTDIPEDGLGIPFEGMEVIVNVSKGRINFGETFYVKYCWVTLDGAESNFKSFIYPSVTNSSTSSNGGSNNVDLSEIEEKLEALSNALNTVNNNVNYEFTVTEENLTMLTFTKEQLGIEANLEFEIIGPQGFNITTDTRLSRRWNENVFEVYMIGGWDLGTYYLKSAQGVRGNPWTMKYIVDEEQTNPSIDLAGGMRYTFTKTLSSLTLNTIEISHLESELVFTTGTNFSINIPDNIEYLGNFDIADGNKYLLNIRDGILVLGTLN